MSTGIVCRFMRLFCGYGLFCGYVGLFKRSVLVANIWDMSILHSKGTKCQQKLFADTCGRICRALRWTLRFFRASDKSQGLNVNRNFLQIHEALLQICKSLLRMRRALERIRRALFVKCRVPLRIWAVVKSSCFAELRRWTVVVLQTHRSIW